MPQRIDVPGMGIVEFPDGMSDADITSAIQKNMPAQNQGAKDLAAQTGRMEALKVSAGKGADSLLDGITQLYLKARGEDQALGGLKQNVDAKAELYAPLKEKYPVITGIGESVPAMAVPVGGGGALAMAARSALGAGSVEALKYGTAKDRLVRGATNAAGAAAGSLAGSALFRALKPAGNGGGVADDALAAAERVGYVPTAGQRTQNPAMQAFENYLAKSPGSSGRMQARASANQSALNTAAARSMGESSDNLGEATFAAAKGKIGSEFERLQQITQPDLAKPEFFNALIQVDSANLARGPYASAKISDQVEKALELASQGKITGKVYKEVRTEIASSADSAFKSGDSTLGQALKTIRDGLDDAAKQSLNTSDRKAWDEARKQWQAYKLLTRGNVAEAGDVSAARVAANLRRQAPGFRAGDVNGDLADIARVGEAFKGVQNPNSGQLAQQMLYGNPLTGVPMAAANYMASAAYMWRPVQSYLTNGVPGVGEKTRYLINRGGSLLAQREPHRLLGGE